MATYDVLNWLSEYRGQRIVRHPDGTWSPVVVQETADQAAPSTTLAGTVNVNVSGGTVVTTKTTPTTFKVIDAVSLTSEVTVWTPASGKKFRLMGGLLSCTGFAGNVVFKDGVGGGTAFVLPNVAVATPVSFDLGNGILSGSVNSVLRVAGGTAQIINGTIWGTED